MPTIAKVTVDTLERAGVECTFGLVGSTILSILDEMKDSGITYISTRHEQVAASAAAAYAMASRRPTVSTSHVGPGAANQIIGITAAYRDNIPVISLTGNEPISQLGKDINHEWDIMDVFEEFTKHNVQVTSHNPYYQVRNATVRAITGMPGAVHIDIPLDIAEMETNAPSERSLKRLSQFGGPASRTHLRPPEDSLDEVADLLTTADRPLLIAGDEIRWFDAAAELREFAELTGIPVATTPNARGALPESHRLSLGYVATSNLKPTNDYFKSADLVMGVGTWFTDKVTGNWELLSEDASLIQATVRDSQLNRFYISDVGIVADPASFLSDLTSLVRDRSDIPSFVDIAEDAHTEVANTRADLLVPDESADGIDPRTVVLEVDKQLDDFAYTTGGGVHDHYPKLLPVDDLNGYFETVNFTAMSQGFPLALGAKLALDDRPVVTFEGDGGFAMVVQDLETAVREEIPVKVIVLNNNAYMSHHVRQREWYDERYIGTTHGNPRYDELAESFGAFGETVSEEEQVSGAVSRLLETDGPGVLEVRVDPNIGAEYST